VSTLNSFVVTDQLLADCKINLPNCQPWKHYWQIGKPTLVSASWPVIKSIYYAVSRPSESLVILLLHKLPAIELENTTCPRICIWNLYR